MSKTKRINIVLGIIIVLIVLFFVGRELLNRYNKQHCNTYCCRVESCDCSEDAKKGNLCKCQYLVDTDEGQTYEDVYCPEQVKNK